MDALCLSLLKIVGTTADKKWKEIKCKHLSLLFRGCKHQQLNGEVSSLKCSLFRLDLTLTAQLFPPQGKSKQSKLNFLSVFVFHLPQSNVSL